jgi:glycosyltransferase involved in cell wall biosynthesis
MLVMNDMRNDPRVSRHAEALGSNGFDVVVICPKSKQTRIREDRQWYVVIRPTNRLLDYVTSMAENLTELNQPRPRLLLARKDMQWLRTATFVLLKLLGTQLTLLKEARAQRADVYCANDLDTLLLAVDSGVGRKKIYDSHELWPDMIIGAPPFFKALLREVEGRLVKHVDVTMTVNEFIAEELMKRHSLRQRPSVVYNTTTPAGKPRYKPAKTKRTKVALYQGRYSPERGLENVVRSAEYLLPDIRIVLRGYGAIEQELRRLGNHKPNVTFEEPVRMEELVGAANEADVGIVPYLPTNLCNYLASPNKLFEYLAAGLPVAASNIPFMRKVILENHIGALFDPYDPKSVAEVLNYITRPATLEACRRNIPHVADRYNWGVDSVKLLEIYRGLISGRR